jgi:hypothetical protein
MRSPSIYWETRETDGLYEAGLQSSLKDSNVLGIVRFLGKGFVLQRAQEQCFMRNAFQGAGHRTIRQYRCLSGTIALIGTPSEPPC